MLQLLTSFPPRVALRLFGEKCVYLSLKLCAMFVLISISVLCALMGMIVLLGKGDNLIAGYNTASEKEKEKYDIARLRLVTGVTVLVVACLLPLLLLNIGDAYRFSISGIVGGICILGVILSNTWAKK